nr:Chain B, Protein FimF [Escherichia coli K-12]5IQN_F Chain F, Protein FimF [Escherichia coli K-12]
SRIRIRGYVR